MVVLVVQSPPASAGDVRDAGSISGSGRSPGGGNGHPLQDSCLENHRDRGSWWAPVHGVAQSWTRRKQLSMHAHRHYIQAAYSSAKYCQKNHFALPVHYKNMKRSLTFPSLDVPATCPVAIVTLSG